MSDHLSRVTRVKKYLEINYLFFESFQRWNISFDINASKIERFGKTNICKLKVLTSNLKFLFEMYYDVLI